MDETEIRQKEFNVFAVKVINRSIPEALNTLYYNLLNCMTIVADASSIILLSKIGLLKTTVVEFEIVIPKRVYDEVMAGKVNGRLDALETEKLVIDKKIITVDAGTKQKDEVKQISGLFAGENEVVAYAKNKKLDVLTDDKKCINAAKSFGLMFMTTLDVVVKFHKKGLIKKYDTIECLNKLENYGWYKHDVLDMYRRMIK